MFTTGSCGIAYPGLGGYISFDQLQHGIVPAVGNDLVEQVRLDLTLLFPQGNVVLPPVGRAVIFIQSPAINISYLSRVIQILETIPPICKLHLTVVQDALSAVSSFFTHVAAPF